MKNYLLLRDNVQSGPYSLDELQRLNLHPDDLVWMERISDRWTPVRELPYLAPVVVPPPPPQPVVTDRAAAPAAPEPLSLAVPGFEERPRRQPRKFSFRPTTRQTVGGAWIIALFGCLIGGSVVVKKILEAPQPVLVSPAKMAAQPLPVLPEEKVRTKPADADYQNALKKETINEDTTKAISSVSLKTLRRQVTVATNEAKTPFPGAPGDLQVKVRNGSEQSLGKVDLLIEFFRANGTRIRQEQYSVHSLKPHSERILIVPPTKRGTKVRYKVIGVEQAEQQQAQSIA